MNRLSRRFDVFYVTDDGDVREGSGQTRERDDETHGQTAGRSEETTREAESCRGTREVEKNTGRSGKRKEEERRRGSEKSRRRETKEAVSQSYFTCTIIKGVSVQDSQQ